MKVFRIILVLAVAGLIPFALLTFIVVMTADECIADGDHGGGFKPPIKPGPPPSPPRTGVGGRAVTGNPGAPGTPVIGGPSTLTKPGGAGTGGAGTATKKLRGGETSTVSWEHWWARNRYQYLDFPSLLDGGKMFPTTPKATDQMVRIEALKKRAIQFFRPLLSHSSARLRRASCLGLARLNDFESLPQILALLRDANQTVRDAAVLALGLMDKPEAKHTLFHLAKGTEEASRSIDQSSVPDYFRGFAQVSLALSDSKGIGAILRSIACDPDTNIEIKAMALESLGLLGGDASAKFLMDFVESSRESDPGLLSVAVAAISKTLEPIVIPFLEKALFSKQMPVRQSAALGLGRVAKPGDEIIVKKLFRCFRSTSDAALKGFSLVSMGLIGGPTAVKYLDQLVMKGGPTECPWACLALGLALREDTDEKAGEHLLHQVVNNANRSTRGAAAIGLGLMKYREAVQPLIGALMSGDDPYYRGYCAMALGMIKDPAAVDSLKTIVSKDDLPPVRTRAVLALALLNEKSAVPELTQLLIESKNEATKIFVALSLVFMGDIRIVEGILEAISGQELDDLTLSHCILLMSKLITGQISPYLNRLAVGSNFAYEYPFFQYLLDTGI